MASERRDSPMTTDATLLNDALTAYGTFYRVLLEDETDISFGPAYVSTDIVAAQAITQGRALRAR